MKTRKEKAMAKITTLTTRLEYIGAELAANDPNGAKWDYVALLNDWQKRTLAELAIAENTYRLAR